MVARRRGKRVEAKTRSICNWGARAVRWFQRAPVNPCRKRSDPKGHFLSRRLLSLGCSGICWMLQLERASSLVTARLHCAGARLLHVKARREQREFRTCQICCGRRSSFLRSSNCWNRLFAKTCWLLDWTSELAIRAGRISPATRVEGLQGAAVAQQEEHDIRNVGVGGSSPLCGTIVLLCAATPRYFEGFVRCPSSCGGRDIAGNHLRIYRGRRANARHLSENAHRCSIHPRSIDLG